MVSSATPGEGIRFVSIGVKSPLAKDGMATCATAVFANADDTSAFAKMLIHASRQAGGKMIDVSLNESIAALCDLSLALMSRKKA